MTEAPCLVDRGVWVGRVLGPSLGYPDRWDVYVFGRSRIISLTLREMFEPPPPLLRAV